MSLVLLTCGFLCLFVGQVLSCSRADHTLYVEKPECDFCVAINTTICMGFCNSWDRNLIGRSPAGQRGCTYEEVEYRTAKLPGCPTHVDPHFSYPVALRCSCRPCDPARDACTHRARADGDRCSKRLLHLPAYPDHSSYIQPF